MYVCQWYGRKLYSIIIRDPGYWRLCHLYLVASNVTSGVSILPSNAYRIMCGGFYGLGQEVAHTTSCQTPLTVAM